MKKKNINSKLSFSKETISSLSNVKGGMPIDETKTCPKTECYCIHFSKGPLCPPPTTWTPR